MPKITNRDDLWEYTHSRLGSPCIKTSDLHRTQFEYIVDQALDRFYEQAVGISQSERILYLPVKSGQSEYDISDMDPQPTAAILNLGDRDTNIWSNLNILFTIENMQVHSWGFNYHTPDILTFQMMYNWLDFFQTMFGLEYRIEIYEHAKVAKILPPPKYDGSVFTAVYVKRPEEELYRYSWVRDYVFAKCLIQIGMNRSKFTGIQLPGGGQLNGDMYFNKGETMLEKLEQQLYDEWSEPPDFYVG